MVNDERLARIRHIQDLMETSDETSGETGDTGDRPRRLGTRRIAIGTSTLVVVAVVVILVVTGTGIGGTHVRRAANAVPTVGFSPNVENGASGAQQTGQAFLAAWQRGDARAAADITDNPSAAYAALAAYRRDLDVSGLTIQPNGVGSAGWLTFSVAAQVGSPTSGWSYTSGLAA